MGGEGKEGMGKGGRGGVGGKGGRAKGRGRGRERGRGGLALGRGRKRVIVYIEGIYGIFEIGLGDGTEEMVWCGGFALSQQIFKY